MQAIMTRFWQKRLPKALLLSILLALAIAPTVQAATGTALDRGQVWAISLLGLMTLALSVYLFLVIVQPERF